jgi:hypothetical protein
MDQVASDRMISFLLWVVCCLAAVIYSWGCGMRCVFETAGGGALGAVLWFQTTSPFPLPRHLWLPALIVIVVGTIAGLVCGSVVRWGYEAHLSSLDRHGCRDLRKTCPRKWYQ